MRDEELKQIEEQYEQAIRGFPGRYIQCISCGREGRSRATLSHQTHCPWGIISALIAALKERDVEVERLKQEKQRFTYQTFNEGSDNVWHRLEDSMKIMHSIEIGDSEDVGRLCDFLNTHTIVDADRQETERYERALREITKKAYTPSVLEIARTALGEEK